ncbi:hypothetical protein M9458_052319, partial [Cirrhinus mrigala]
MKEAKEDIKAAKASLGRSEKSCSSGCAMLYNGQLKFPMATEQMIQWHLIEGLYLGIQQKKKDLYRTTDRNKQRRKIRRRIVEEKLSDAICQYNSLATSSTKALNSADELLAAERPIWPWECVDDASLGLKKTIFDKLMQLERLEEEEAILEEMKRHWSHICRTIKNVNDQTDVLSDGLATK